MAVHACNLRREKQDNQKIRDILRCRVSSRPSWDTLDPVSKKKKKMKFFGRSEAASQEFRHEDHPDLGVATRRCSREEPRLDMRRALYCGFSSSRKIS